MEGDWTKPFSSSGPIRFASVNSVFTTSVGLKSCEGRFKQHRLLRKTCFLLHCSSLSSPNDVRRIKSLQLEASLGEDLEERLCGGT